MGQHLLDQTSLWMIAFALGMDTLSISLAFGMQALRLKRIFLIGLTFGVFHFCLPLVGMTLGNFLIPFLGRLPMIISGVILFIIGAHLFFSAFLYRENRFLPAFGLGLLLISLSVSLDSFTVGLSIGILGIRTFFICILFGGISITLAWIGMLVGRKIYHYIGKYSEILGGIILCTIACWMIFT